MIPTKLFLTKGVGRHKEKLASFEMALRNARIAPFNLVETSSIIPPRAELVELEEGLKYLKPGEIVYCVLSRNSTDEPGRLISASVGLAIPKDRDHYGYLSEHHAFGMDEDEACDYAEDLAVTMLASTMGIEIDPHVSWDEKKKIYRISELVVTSTSVTAVAKGQKGVWTTVIAAAVFVP